MKTGRCPKCGSTDVRVGHGIRGPYGIGSIPLSWFSSIKVDRYVCMYCGYVETYVADQDGLRNVAENWPPVNMAKQS